jgi:hypothetical protein
VVWRDGQLPSVPANASAPSCKLYNALKKVSKMSGRFSEIQIDPNLRNQARLVVLKVNENYSNQMPSVVPVVKILKPILPEEHSYPS